MGQYNVWKIHPSNSPTLSLASPLASTKISWIAGWYRCKHKTWSTEHWSRSKHRHKNKLNYSTLKHITEAVEQMNKHTPSRTLWSTEHHTFQSVESQKYNLKHKSRTTIVVADLTSRSTLAQDQNSENHRTSAQQNTSTEHMSTIIHK